MGLDDGRNEAGPDTAGEAARLPAHAGRGFEAGGGEVILRTSGLAKRYGSHDAVRDLDLAVRRGEIYGFLGPNGAGKTTTLLMLLGIEQPTAGLIERFGRVGPIDPFRDKTRIGVVGEQQYLYDDLTAWEYLLFFAALYRVEQPRQRAQELLERLDLYELRRLRARDFSRGMQQKLGLARALLHRPELLILDEPVSGLDPHGIRQVREILTEENARGVTILVSSHILSEVERTAHRVGILYGGRLVAEDDVATLSARLEPDPILELDVEQLAPGTVELLREQPFVREVAHDEGRLRVRVAADGDHRRDVSAVISGHGGLITAMRQERLSLEEAFVRLTQEDLTPPAPLAAPERGETASVIEGSSIGQRGRGIRDGSSGEQIRTGGWGRLGASVEQIDAWKPAPTMPCTDVGAGSQLTSPAGHSANPPAQHTFPATDYPTPPSGLTTPAGDAASPPAQQTAQTTHARNLPVQQSVPATEDPSSPLPASPLSTPVGALFIAPAGGMRSCWHTIWVLARRDLLGMLYGPGIYLVVALGMLATLPVIAGYLDVVERNHVLILADAFTLPFFVAATIAMLLLALASVATVARERDQGTLEVLFYGPVDLRSYVLAKHLAHVLAYLPIAFGLATLMLAYAGMTGLRLPQAFALELLLSAFTAAAVAALGVCLSTLVRGVRPGIALLAVLAAAFLAIRVGSELLSGIAVTNNVSPLLVLRNVVLTVDAVVEYVSPFGLFQSGVDGLVRQDLLAYLSAILLSCLQCAVLLLMSVRLLARRGVRR